MKLFQSKLSRNDVVAIYPDGSTSWMQLEIGVIEDRIIDGASGKDEYVTSCRGGKIAERRFMIKINKEQPKNLWERILRFFKGEI